MSNKFQPGIKFTCIDDFLNYISEDELLIVDKLRNLIFEEIPDVKEKLSYNVPFYSRKQRICHIWPASIPWGNTPMEGVQLGFSKGYLIDHPAVAMGSRKEVGVLTYHKINDIDEEMIRSILLEALLIDNEA
ncbi:MAG: DUF1801 domain-containing protein [Cyclobacteriaceae bacterium]